ncbi:MAG: Hpt domain-containing protein, partial [Chloroflexota bacterium]
MEIVFDISEDEVPIFLAEVDEHLQVLDDILIRLEKEDTDSELVQTIFRSAHTIKGMAGMIGHRRMTDLTHALESALDGVRKKSILISTPLINTCLEAVDRLRLLREEVVTAQTSDIDIEELVQDLKDLTQVKQDVSPLPTLVSVDELAALFEKTDSAVVAADNKPVANTPVDMTRAVHIRAIIPVDSIASAARAFQLMMALQELGEIQEMNPTQAQIETASAVKEFTAVLISSESFEKISADLNRISGLDQVFVDGVSVLVDELPVSTAIKKTASDSSESSVVNGNGSLPAEPSGQAGYGRRATDVGGGRRASDVAARPAAEVIGRRSTDMTVRTNVERLDSLMNLVGELITDRNHLQQIRGRLEADNRSNNNIEQLSESVTHLGRITDQLQEEVMRIRMLPVGSVFNKFPRMVRDMAQKVGKQIDVIIHGEETEMDRSMIDEINDPLI